MRVVSAYLLALLGGNASPTAADIKTILGAVDIEADDASITKLISELDGKDIAEVIAAGREKLQASGGGGGGGGGGAAAAAPAAGGGGGGGAAKEAKKEESEESGDDDMGFGLFD